MPNIRRGFTLIELLVVIAIIAILAAILFPVFAKARGKARQITCISNEKQIGLGMMQYFQDYDEKAPFTRVSCPDPACITGSWWWTAQMLSWKDAIYPYIKNGGRPYNNGQPYTDHGGGGVFFCPENSASWSNASVWWTIGSFSQPGSAGDETTRFPRGYAVNSDVGLNENGPNHFWPCVGDNSCNNNSGQIASLQTPASSIMVAETRLPFPDVKAQFTGYECQPNGQPYGGVPNSCIQGHGAGFTNFVFFDGHAKSVRAVQAIKDDLWDAYGPNGYGANQQAQDLASAGSVPEWGSGF